MSRRIARTRNNIHIKKRKPKYPHYKKKVHYSKKELIKVPEKVTLTIDVALLPYISKLIETNSIESIKNLEQYNFKIIGDFSMKQLREYWIYLMHQDRLFCSLCGKKIVSNKGRNPNRLTAEHRNPKFLGGKTTVKNCIPAHAKCNGIKGCLSPKEWEQYGLGLLINNKIEIDLSKVFWDYKQKIK